MANKRHGWTDSSTAPIYSTALSKKTMLLWKKEVILAGFQHLAAGCARDKLHNAAASINDEVQRSE